MDCYLEHNPTVKSFQLRMRCEHSVKSLAREGFRSYFCNYLSGRIFEAFRGALSNLPVRLIPADTVRS